MRLAIVLSLTAIAALCLILQYRRPKGTTLHYFRGFLVGYLSLLVVVLNTYYISSQRGLTWDTAFIVHTTLGGIFILSWLVTIIFGLTMRVNARFRVYHRTGAHITTIFFCLSLLAATLVRFLR